MSWRLKDMNLQVNQGDFISLLGPSGCGKSTALRIISDLMYPTRGSVDWEGEHGRGDLGVVFQEPTLMPWATVAQNVWLPFRLAGKSYAEVKDDVLEVLRLVGLEKFQNAYPARAVGRHEDARLHRARHRDEPAPDPDGRTLRRA
jgi:NitT/TauT family transport system ATP-binding protein